MEAGHFSQEDLRELNCASEEEVKELATFRFHHMQNNCSMINLGL